MSTETYIDTFCDGCGKRLRVAAEHALKQARCPHCQATYTVPPHNTVSSAGYELNTPAAPTGQTWQMKSPAGLVYGPVSKEELDGWRDEGRITHRSQLLPVGGDQWLWAADVYPELTAAAPMTPISTQPVDSSQQRPLAPTLHSYYASGILPHRGPLVLVLGLVGVFTLCALPSAIGLLLGLYDLRLMKRDKMDPAGHSMTIAGIVLSASWIVLQVALIIVGVAWAMS